MYAYNSDGKLLEVISTKTIPAGKVELKANVVYSKEGQNKLISIYKTQNIPQDQFAPLKQRLESLGFFPETEVEVLKKISFGHVVIVRIFQTVVALNKLEFSCLKF